MSWCSHDDVALGHENIHLVALEPLAVFDESGFLHRDLEALPLVPLSIVCILVNLILQILECGAAGAECHKYLFWGSIEAGKLPHALKRP